MEGEIYSPKPTVKKHNINPEENTEIPSL